MKVIEVDEQCKSCKGTGLYVGIAERDGMSVVCHNCKGTGCYHFKHQYEDFTERQKAPNVLRVVRVNPGITLGVGNGTTLTDYGGMPYSEWLMGNDFTRGTEDRKHTCPAWWYQSADYEKKPSWDECLGCGSFSGCKHFASKARCWERWDAAYST